MIRKNILSIGVSAALCAALLCGCGGGSASSAASSAASAAGSTAASAAASSAAGSTASAASADLSGIQDALLKADPISNPFTINDTTVQLDMSLTADQYTAYSGVKSNDSGDAGLVFVVQAADGKADALVSALEAYRDAQVEYLSNYAEQADAKANMENAVIEANGNIVVMAVVSNDCTDAAGLAAAVDSALGK